MEGKVLASGAVVVRLPGSSEACDEMVRALQKRFLPQGVGIISATAPSDVPAIDHPAEDFCRPSADPEAIAAALSQGAEILTDFLSEVRGSHPALIAVWTGTHQLISAHLVAKFLRATHPPDVYTALTGPGIFENIERWIRSPAVLGSILKQVGFYVAGDPVVGLEVLVRDHFRLESQLHAVPGLIWLEADEIRINKPSPQHSH